MQVTTIGFDLAKNVFQVHGIAESGAGGRAQTPSTRSGAGVLHGSAALPGRHGGLRERASLGFLDDAHQERVDRLTFRFPCRLDAPGFGRRALVDSFCLDVPRVAPAMLGMPHGDAQLLAGMLIGNRLFDGR
jgi:hypothetical protein